MNEHGLGHPGWCHPDHCTVPDRPLLGAQGGAHRSQPVPLGMEATIRGETGPVHAQLQQSARPGTAVFVAWLIGGEHVGHIRLEQAAPIALLIAAGMDVLERADAPTTLAPTSDV